MPFVCRVQIRQIPHALFVHCVQICIKNYLSLQVEPKDGDCLLRDRKMRLFSPTISFIKNVYCLIFQKPLFAFLLLVKMLDWNFRNLRLFSPQTKPIQKVAKKRKMTCKFTVCMSFYLI